jgi:hypothetical protein
MRKIKKIRTALVVSFYLTLPLFGQEAEETTATTESPAEQTSSSVEGGRYGISAFGHYSLSIADFKTQVSDYNFGGSLQVDYRDARLPVELYTEVGFASYNPAVTTLTSLMGVSFGIGAGYPISLKENLDLIPALYSGGNVFLSEGIYSGATQSKTVLDSYQKLSLHLSFKLDQVSRLTLSPYIMVVPEEKIIGLLPGISLGYGYQL